MMKRALLTVSSLLAFSACSLAPEYHAPAMETPAAFKEQPADWHEGKPADQLPRANWWEMFGNAELNGLEQQVTDANQDLKAALAHYEGARAMAAEARADYFPQVTANANATRVQNSAALATPTLKRRENDYALTADVSYELDFWGKVRNEVAAQTALADASAADLETARLSLHAELASDYFALRGDDASQAVLDETVKDDARVLRLVEAQHVGGIVAETDVDTARAQLELARTQAEDMRLKRAQLEHALAVLVGKAPAEFSLAAAPLLVPKVAPLPGLPSALLEQRPDIASAERRVAAANAEIGVARAAYFPDFSLSGDIGYEAATLGHLASASSLLWALGPNMVATLFDGGRHDAQLEQAHAATDEAAAHYRQAVLMAYQEVEDQLAADRQLAKEAVSAKAASDAAGKALARTNDRYNGGLITYLDVVVVQNQALSARLTETDVETRAALAQVALIKALGGGWHNSTEK